MRKPTWRLIGLAAVLAASALIVPIGAQADHCRKVIIFTGVNTGVPNPQTGNPVRPGINLGSAGCTTSTAHLPDTNVLTPGANSASVGALPGAGSGLKATGGTFIMGSQIVTLIFPATCSAGAQCNSQSFDLTDPGASSATAWVSFSDASSDSITYRKAGS